MVILVAFLFEINNTIVNAVAKRMPMGFHRLLLVLNNYLSICYVVCHWRLCKVLI